MSASEMETATCDMCGMTAVLLACSRCKRAHYCGPDCQKAAWPSHKPLCKKTASGPSIPSSSADAPSKAPWEGDVPVKVFALPEWPSLRASAGWLLPPLSPKRWQEFFADESGDTATGDLKDALWKLIRFEERAASSGSLGAAAKAAVQADADFGFRESVTQLFTYLLSSRFRFVSFKVHPAEHVAPRSKHDDDALLVYLHAVRRLPSGAPVLELAYTDSKAVNVGSRKRREEAARAAQEVWDVAVPAADRERAAAASAAALSGCPHESDIPAGRTGIIDLKVHAGEMAVMRAALARNAKRSAPPPWLASTFPVAAATPIDSGGFRASFLTLHSPVDPAFHTAPYAASTESPDLAAWRAAMLCREHIAAAAFAASPRGVRGRAEMLRRGLECIMPFSIEQLPQQRPPPRPIRLSEDTPEAARALLGHARLLQAVTYEWADGLDREMVYVTLIDAYRLRVEDTEKFQRVRVGLAAGEDPFAGFAAFLASARTRRGFLSADWTDADDAAALELGRTHVWANLRRRAGKPEMASTYGMDCLRHSLLRSMAAVVTGTQVDTGAAVRFGADGRAVLGQEDAKYFHA